MGIVALTGAVAASASAAVRDTGASPAVSAATPATAQAEALRDIEADAHSTLDDARTAVADATKIAADIVASGLEVGPATSIDTTDLEKHIDRLAGLDLLPLLLLPGIAEDTAAETERVTSQVAELRAGLAAAQQKKAAEEAAAKARAEAEAAAKAKAEAEAAAAAALAAANTPEGAKATARRLLGEYGWGGDQFGCLESLWTRESGWNYQAYNASSGATGIPQALPGGKMASAGADWQTNATTQIRWGLGYIASVYGTPCGAWGHSNATGWY